MPSIITSFGTIRLSGNLITTSGARLQVASDATLMIRDSGAWPSRSEWLASSGGLQSQIQSTGQQALMYVNGMGQIISGNLTLTGQTLYNLITTASGVFVPTGSMLAFTTGVLTGADTQYINYLNYTFASIPKVVVEWEQGSFSNYSYFTAISGRQTTGVTILYSDIIAESGNILNVIAKT